METGVLRQLESVWFDCLIHTLPVVTFTVQFSIHTISVLRKSQINYIFFS